MQFDSSHCLHGAYLGTAIDVRLEVTMNYVLLVSVSLFCIYILDMRPKLCFIL